MLSSQKSAAPKPDHPTIKPGTAGRTNEHAVPETEQIKEKAWEKDEMAKIKERYMKLKSTTLAWEEKKKKKAKNKLDRAERGLERKIARALLNLEKIRSISNKQKMEQEHRQRQAREMNLKQRKKTNIIRTTGEVPRTCICC
ncbi:remorin 1.4-like [Hibiscus syriacus]|uniref:remorin 1.4-like n=1 Tax=Hibiscus syriacus TaxID=106335 RepID=UPI0019243E3A|nr:remorin 1.4-like [Hibiscus syriacus]